MEKESFSRTLKHGAATLALLGAVSSPAQASYSQVFFFGDSLSDTGNLYTSYGFTFPVSPPYYNGMFSNGPLWTATLAGYLGNSAIPSLWGGTNFAWAGATVIDYGRPQPEVPQQLGQYFATVGGVADPKALYVIFGGNNDINDASKDPATAPTNIVLAAHAVDSMVDSLYAAGARNILVSNLPDMGKTPLAISKGPAAVAGATALTNLFNSTLGSLLDSDAAADPGLNLDRLDVHALLDSAYANPAAYGFTNVTDPCKAGGGDDLGLPGAVCATPDSYLFWDVFHPSSAAHNLIAEAAMRAVPEPAPWSLIVVALLGMLAAAPCSSRTNRG